VKNMKVISELSCTNIIKFKYQFNLIVIDT
jgi:hypothetical protein